MEEITTNSTPAAGERPDGSTPETAVPAENIPKRPVARYLDFTLHEAVQKLQGLGIWCALGPRFGDLQVRLRPFHVGAVVAKREAAERGVRVRLGLNDQDPIPDEEQIGITRAAMTMAVTDLSGQINVGATDVKSIDPEIFSALDGALKARGLARDNGFAVVEEEGHAFIVFEPLVGKVSPEERAKHSERVRKVFAPLLEASITLLTQLFTTSKALQRVRDEEIAKQGEAYVYGRPGEFDWAD